MTADDRPTTAARVTNDELRVTSKERAALVTRHSSLVTPAAVGGRRSIILILAAFLLLGFAYSAINPLHEATDELRHYRFVQFIIQRHALPIQGEGSGLDCTVQGHHPPLYYAAAALLTAWIDTGRDVCHEPPGNPFWAYRYWEVGRDNKNQYLHGPDEAFPWQGEALAAHLARVVNLLFGALTVWLTWRTARAIWPGRPALAAGSAAFVAFNPMFLYMAGAINNDVVAAAAGAAVVYACVRLMQDERGLSPRWGLILGALYGLALLSKFNLAAILLVIEAAVTWVAWRRGQWRQWVVVNVLIAGVAGLLAGWWFARNQILYGEPTGVERLTELWGVRDPRDSFWLAVSELPYAWTSLWGRFGYGQIPLPAWFYWALFGVVVLAMAGYVVNWARARRGAGQHRHNEGLSPRLSRLPVPLLLLLSLNVAVFFAVLFNYLLVSPAGPMGRFFFPALSSLAILVFYGLSLLLPTTDRRPPTVAGETEEGGKGEDVRGKALLLPFSFSPLLSPGRRSAVGVLSLAANLFMLALSLIALFGFLAPAYARPPEYAAGEGLPNPVDIHFDTLVALRGYTVDRDTARPGEPIAVELYWEVTGQPPGDYLLFVHLLDTATGAPVGQRDTHPGLGNFPSSQWRPGDRFVERLSLYVPETAYVPGTAELRVGFYAPEGYRLGVSDGATGAGLGDSFPIGQVSLLPTADNGNIPNPGNYLFEDRVRLMGYDYDRRVLGPSDALTVTLHWGALDDDPGALDVQVRLLDTSGNVVYAGQEPLLPPSPGDVTIASYAIPADLARPPGVFTVQIALEDPETDRRVQWVAEDGRWLDDKITLSPVVWRGE